MTRRMDTMEDLEFRYDTQLLLDKYGLDEDEADDLVDEIRDHIIDTFNGDCLLVAGDTGEDEVGGEKATIKLHYHTNEPWLVLEYCRSVGEIYDIVVEDMQRQSAGLKG
jgi:dihydroxyacetone kinase-like predicted kinase